MAFADEQGQVIAALPTKVADLLVEDPKVASKRLSIWQRAVAGELSGKELITELRDSGLDLKDESLGSLWGKLEVFDDTLTKALGNARQAVAQGEDPITTSALLGSLLFADKLEKQQLIEFLLGLVPVVGQVGSAVRFAAAIGKGDLGGAAMELGGALLGLVPLGGAGRAVTTVERGTLGATDDVLESAGLKTLREGEAASSALAKGGEEVAEGTALKQADEASEGAATGTRTDPELGVAAARAGSDLSPEEVTALKERLSSVDQDAFFAEISRRDKSSFQIARFVGEERWASIPIEEQVSIKNNLNRELGRLNEDFIRPFTTEKLTSEGWEVFDGARDLRFVNKDGEAIDFNIDFVGLKPGVKPVTPSPAIREPLIGVQNADRSYSYYLAEDVRLVDAKFGGSVLSTPQTKAQRAMELEGLPAIERRTARLVDIPTERVVTVINKAFARYYKTAGIAAADQRLLTLETYRAVRDDLRKGTTLAGFLMAMLLSGMAAQPPRDAGLKNKEERS